MAGATNVKAGDTQCLLHIPHKEVGKELVDLLLEVVEATPTQRRELQVMATEMGGNYLAIERWARHFYFNCICDCGNPDT